MNDSCSDCAFRAMHVLVFFSPKLVATCSLGDLLSKNLMPSAYNEIIMLKNVKPWTWFLDKVLTLEYRVFFLLVTP